MKNKKYVWFSAFRRVVPADLEMWFERMELSGWHVRKIGQWSSILMAFEKSEPKKYRYVFDMQAFPRREYRVTWEQFGWEYLGAMASAQIWRKAYEDERPEAFTQPSDVAGRNIRTAAAVGVCLVLFIVVALIVAYPLIFSQKVFSNVDNNQLWGFLALCAVFFVLLLLVFIKILRNKDR